MTKGILRLNWAGEKPEASIGPDGWESRDKRLLRVLESDYPPPSTEAGTPWVIAFWEAVRGLEAEAIQEPVANAYEPLEAANG